MTAQDRVDRPAPRVSAIVSALPVRLRSRVVLILASLAGLAVFGWPLVIGGAIKASYDILLLIKFQTVRPPEETSLAE